MSYRFSTHSVVAATLFAVLTCAAPASLLAQTASQATTPTPASPPAATTAAPPAATPAPATKTKKTKKSKAAAAVTPDAAAPATAPAAEPAKSAAAPAAAGAPVFPTAVSAKYASQKAGDARMHTCLDQYHANKAANGNGGLKWIQKGGGYYSECSKKLKG